MIKRSKAARESAARLRSTWRTQRARMLLAARGNAVKSGAWAQSRWHMLGVVRAALDLAAVAESSYRKEDSIT